MLINSCLSEFYLSVSIILSVPLWFTVSKGNFIHGSTDQFQTLHNHFRGPWHKISIFQKLGQGHDHDLIFEKLSKIAYFSTAPEDIYTKQKAMYLSGPWHKLTYFKIRSRPWPCPNFRNLSKMIYFSTAAEDIYTKQNVIYLGNPWLKVNRSKD